MFGTFFLRIFTIIILCNSVVLGTEEGEACTFPNGNRGTCRFLTNCPTSFEALTHGILFQTCGFAGTQLIVCCGEGADPPPPPARPRISTYYLRGSQNPHRSGPYAIENSEPAPPHSEVRGAQRPHHIEKPEPAPPPSEEVMFPSKGNRTPGQVSELKCKEYAKYAYNREESPTLIGKVQFSPILECPFEKTAIIVGGKEAGQHEFPHMALIGYEIRSEVTWACAGTLISSNFVLTAGHCLIDPELGPAKHVRLGITNQTDLTHMQEFTVTKIIENPKYTNALYHDIGLLKLDNEAYLTPYVRPACLHTQKQIPFKQGIASGWGKIDFDKPGSKDLLKVVLEFYKTEQCNATYRTNIITPGSTLREGIREDFMICAGSPTKIKDTCKGDSGGPLQVYHEDTEDIKCMYEIVGITSFGKSCGRIINSPGVYTRVSAYLEWIEDVVWP